MVQLPCNISLTLDDDSIRLILWFKDTIPGGPIYSIDTRKSELHQAKHFSSYDSISLRASFSLNTNPAYLILDPLREEDSGEYKCRVDFNKGRTLTTIVKLTVIGEWSENLITELQVPQDWCSGDALLASNSFQWFIAIRGCLTRNG